LQTYNAQSTCAFSNSTISDAVSFAVSGRLSIISQSTCRNTLCCSIPSSLSSEICKNITIYTSQFQEEFLKNLSQGVSPPGLPILHFLHFYTAKYSLIVTNLRGQSPQKWSLVAIRGSSEAPCSLHGCRRRSRRSCQCTTSQRLMHVRKSATGTRPVDGHRDNEVCVGTYGAPSLLHLIAPVGHGRRRNGQRTNREHHCCRFHFHSIHPFNRFSS